MMDITSNDKSLNCFQFLTVNAAKHFGCDYRLMMLELWGFQYDCNNIPIIGERLNLCWKSKLENRKHLLNYHGLSFDIHNYDLNTCEQILIDKSENNVVAIYIDSYDCAWLPFYMNMHRSHALFITGMTSNCFIIQDQYSEELEISKTFVKANAQKMVLFHKYRDTSTTDISKYLIDSLIKWDDRYFHDYNGFIFDMKNILDIKKEIIGDPITSKLIMYLKNIADDRKNITQTISLLEDEYLLDLSSTKNRLICISQEYEKIRMHLVKCSYLSKPHSTSKIAESLDTIIKQEYKIYTELKSIIIKV